MSEPVKSPLTMPYMAEGWENVNDPIMGKVFVSSTRLSKAATDKGVTR